MAAEQARAGENRWGRYAQAADGLAEYWYPIMASAKLRRRPVHRRLLGQDVVLVRHQGRARSRYRRDAANFPAT